MPISIEKTVFLGRAAGHYQQQREEGTKSQDRSWPCKGATLGEFMYARFAFHKRVLQT